MPAYHLFRVGDVEGSRRKNVFIAAFWRFLPGTGIGRRGRRGFVHNKQQPIDPAPPRKGAGGRDRRRTGSGRPERTDIAPAAATSSLSPSGPFMATILPPGLTRGRRYSHSTGSPATARAVATSNCSRRAGRRPASSALAWISAAGTASSRQRPSKMSDASEERRAASA